MCVFFYIRYFLSSTHFSFQLFLFLLKTADTFFQSLALKFPKILDAIDITTSFMGEFGGALHADDHTVVRAVEVGHLVHVTRTSRSGHGSKRFRCQGAQVVEVMITDGWDLSVVSGAGRAELKMALKAKGLGRCDIIADAARVGGTQHPLGVSEVCSHLVCRQLVHSFGEVVV